MKLTKILSLAAMTTLGLSAAVHAAPTLTAFLTETPVNNPNNGVYTVSLFASDSGVSEAGDGDGGIAGFQFNIVGLGDASPGHGSGAKANQVTTTFPSSITNNFSTIAPQYTVDGAGHDAPNGSFFDASSFSFENMGVGSPALIESQTWTLTDPNKAATLSLAIIGPTSYDDNSAATNFHDDITVVNATGVVLPAVPEPASLSLLGLGALSLAARRRKA